jgi:catechol 2,3-dioxygenase-like lactoylglutathione lyase family enzyme
MLKDYTKGIQHIGLPTNDLQATIGFYQTLGFEVVHKTQIDCKVCFLKLDNLVIETYENKQAVMKAGAIDHISLDCTDIDAAFEEVRKLGFEIIGGRIEALPFWKKGVQFFKFEGPNKEIIEYCQIL